MINAIPGPQSYPFIGSAHMFIGKSRREYFSCLRSITKPYSGIMKLWIGSTVEVRISRAEYVETLLSSSKAHLQKAWAYKFIASWLGDGLLTSLGGKKWSYHRKMITPTFHFSILETFCEIFANKTTILLQKLDKHANTNKSFDIYPYITKAALDIIADAAMGTQISAQDDTENEYVKAVYEVPNLIMRRIGSPWLQIDWIYKFTKDGQKMNKNLAILCNLTNNIIAQRKANWKSDSNTMVNPNEGIMCKQRLAFLDLLLETSEKGPIRLSDIDLREEVETFMFAGHDTTTVGITWALLLLALHPDIQEQCYDELETIFQGSDRQFTLKDLNDMKVLDRVMKETLRLCPTVPIIGRTLSEDIQIDQYTIPAGSTVAIDLFDLHMDEKYFPDPERFDPNRFLLENTVGRHPYAYIPFSAGPRNCIGQKFAIYEEKSILSSIIRKYRLTTNAKLETIDKALELILRPIDGVPIFLEKRT